MHHDIISFSCVYSVMYLLYRVWQSSNSVPKSYTPEGSFFNNGNFFTFKLILKRVRLLVPRYRKTEISMQNKLFKNFPLCARTQDFVSLSSLIKYILRLCVIWICNMRCSAVRCSAVRCGAVRCSTVQIPVQIFFVCILLQHYEIHTLMERGSFMSVFFNGTTQLSLQATVWKIIFLVAT